MILNNVIVIRGTAYEVVDMGTQSIESGTWVTVASGETFLIVDEYNPVDTIKEIPCDSDQPFWSKQGKNKKGGRSRY